MPCVLASTMASSNTPVASREMTVADDQFINVCLLERHCQQPYSCLPISQDSIPPKSSSTAAAENIKHDCAGQLLLTIMVQYSNVLFIASYIPNNRQTQLEGIRNYILATSGTLNFSNARGDWWILQLVTRETGASSLRKAPS